ncbi:glutamine synthetase, partial [Mesorhizobium sp. M00.F.Ca.ET.038.03.1.1]
FEYRAADAAASPHLALASILHAGVQGIEDGLPPPQVTQENLAVLSEAQLSDRGYKRLPQSLEEALQRFEENDVVTGWFPGDFASIYTAHKRAEIAHLGDRAAKERCSAYSKVY